jgi:hypothetical protein
VIIFKVSAVDVDLYLVFLQLSQEASVATASTARAVADALATVARAETADVQAWRPKLADALMALGAAGEADAAAAAERLQGCVFAVVLRSLPDACLPLAS